MTDALSAVRGWIGERRYPSRSIEVEESVVRSFCAAVEDGHPEYWRRAEPGRPRRTPQAMLSVWMRPEPWSPTGGAAVPLQTHFDVKQQLDLPEAVIAEYSFRLGDPILVGDTLQVHESLKSVSDTKKTRLGTGRFWAIEVVYERADGAWAGSETYLAFGYRRHSEPAQTPASG